MIISDGTTNLTFNGTQMDDFLDIEQSSTRTAGGNTRTIRAGKRFKVIEKIRMTGSQFGTLINLLTNNSEDYFYTPTITPDYLTSSDFPMSVNIGRPTKIRQAGGGVKKFYVELPIEGSSYL
jgi:hypothetical protein